MITVALHGPLGEKYGHEYRFNAATPAEVIRALGYQIKGFIDDLREGKFALLRDSLALDIEHMDVPFGKANTFHIVPVPGGSGSSGGIGKIIAGAIIIGAAFAFAPTAFGAAPGIAGALGGVASSINLGATAFAGISFTQIAAAGGLLVAVGAAQLLSPTPQVGNPGGRERPENRASFLLNSQVNQTEEGGVVPVLLGGPLRIGSHLIAASLGAYEVPIEDVLSEEIEFDSFHGFATEHFNFTTDTIQFRGMTKIQVRDEDLSIEIGKLGNLAPGVFRNREVCVIGEVRDTVTDEYFFHVVIGSPSVLPRDFFDIVTVSNVDETVEYLELSPNSATEYTPEGESRNTFESYTDGLTGTTLLKKRRCTRWTWNRGVGVGFAVPEGAGQAVRFAY